MQGLLKHRRMRGAAASIAQETKRFRLGVQEREQSRLSEKIVATKILRAQSESGKKPPVQSKVSEISEFEGGAIA